MFAPCITSANGDQEMSKSTRRQFILRSATQAASLGLVLNGKLITLPPSLLPGPAGPNDRVNLGFIGFGIRGNILLEAAKETRQANLVEVCDATRGTSNAQRSAPKVRSRRISHSTTSCSTGKTSMRSLWRHPIIGISASCSMR